MHAAGTGGEREREGEGGRKGEAMRVAEEERGEAWAEEGGWKPRGEGGERWARKRARKKKRAAGGRTKKEVTLDTSHSLSGWLKEVAPPKRYYAER